MTRSLYAAKRKEQSVQSINQSINQSIILNSDYAKPILSPSTITILNLDQTQTGPANAEKTDASNIWS
ncbi:MAG: hypothetical protein NTU49_07745 [Gammaproteobacteria bacterium]|nr:hypothetical protein [Gammaproteobacteria bacterium]